MSRSVRSVRCTLAVAALMPLGLLAGPLWGCGDADRGAATPARAASAAATPSASKEAVAAETRVVIEDPPFTLLATEILDDGLRKGAHFSVVEQVANDGYMNTYQLESEFGSFTAEGTDELRRRIHELGAIAQLVEVSRTEAFADAVKSSATRQARAAKQVIEEPVETVKGIPGGVKRFVKKTSRQVKDLREDADEAYDEQKAKQEAKKQREAELDAQVAAGEITEEEKQSQMEQFDAWWDEEGKALAKQGGKAAYEYGKQWVGYTPSRRRWAQELGVDPYTDNEVLNKELNRVSQAAAVGSLGMKFVPIPKVDVLGYMKDASDLVWKMDPLDLRMHNEQILYPMGATEEQVEALYGNKFQTPTTITLLVGALAAMDGVEGRMAWIVKASEVDSRAGADFMVRAVNFLAAYHQKKKTFTSMVGGEHYPHALTTDATLIFAAPMDYIHWTEDLAALAAEQLPKLVESTDARSLEVWIEGSLSDRARQGLEQHGFEVHTHAFEGLEVTFGEAGAATGASR
jgi:hypothetical protein